MYLWIAISIAFEVIGDVLVKKASLAGGFWWLASFAAYSAMLLAWFVAIRQAGVLTIPGLIWLLSGQVALVAVGVGMFGEVLSLRQIGGSALAFVALIMLGT